MEEDTKVQQFRIQLNELKSKRFFQKLVDESDNKSIQRRIREANQIFTELLQAILNPAKKQLTDTELQELLSGLGPYESWSESLVTKLKSVLQTDLLEYPLTFNSELIKQFKEQPKYPTFY